ncbi:MAG: DUF805 domain-containing protein [Rhodospirillaceae bacterium]|nr:DUF805 domain-containing protein [Rhodospirillaceae bacterium]MBT6511683.1 DUF805 domain-containing protein [Rhodospirillaceae bacterium]MBT7614782.1 DUF805 domain-containing protein [Rhodospirillaceae bacterium]MBT7648241.1 DUF805 domain-containing protein [Rhodospirillaceae bacterium]
MDYKWLLLSFEGRLNRQPYWMTALAFMVGSIVVGVLDAIVFGSVDSGMPVLTLIYSLAIVWPALAIAVKRLHDRGRSGWFYLLVFVPILNIWPMIEILFLRGTDGANDYGADPLGTA